MHARLICKRWAAFDEEQVQIGDFIAAFIYWQKHLAALYCLLPYMPQITAKWSDCRKVQVINNGMAV